MKRFTIFALTLMLLATGCSSGGGNSSSSAPEVVSDPPGVEIPEEEIPQVDEPAPNSGEDDQPALIENQYDGLEISAAVLERKAILPGSAIPVTVEIKNNGDKTIAYTQGSGVFEVPDALTVEVDGLQPALTKDRVGGVMTMDFVTKDLEPGESLTYTVYVMAIEPNQSFDDYTRGHYEDEDGYLPDMEWDQLNEAYPDLVAAQPGSYTCTVTFRYAIKEDDDMLFLGEATGYNTAEYVISVTD